MAGQLTGEWAGNNFLPSQIVQAIGQSLALTSSLWFALQHLDISQVFTFGALLQTARLFGGELGSAFIQTFLRVREQIYSNLIGLHITVGSGLTDQRLQDYARIVGDRSTGNAVANARATALLARAVQDQANVLAFIDGFMCVGFAVIAALLLMLLLRDLQHRKDRLKHGCSDRTGAAVHPRTICAAVSAVSGHSHCGSVKHGAGGKRAQRAAFSAYRGKFQNSVVASDSLRR